jgi:hypothetical protein
MPQNVYCWRCRIEVPMLDEGEWAELAPLLSKVPQDIKAYRESTGAPLDQAVRQGFERAALARYEQLTGFPESNVNALWHHRLADVGPPCDACGKPMRTRVARFCAECGHWPSNDGARAAQPSR